MVEQVMKSKGKIEKLEKFKRHNTAEFRKLVNNLKTYQVFDIPDARHTHTQSEIGTRITELTVHLERWEIEN